MNILILTHSYPDPENKFRGVFVKEQARALSLDHNVIVVYFKVDYSRLSPFSNYRYSKKETGKISVYTVTTGRSFPVINQVKYLYDTYKFLCKHILDKEEIDVINSHLSYPAGFLGALIRRFKNIPVVITEHSWIRKHFRSFIHKKCVIWALKNCSSIVAVSSSLKSDISDFTEKHISVVPNVIDAERFPLIEAKNDEWINIGILGGLNNNRKGIDILLRSAAALENRNFIIHIGGDGKLLSSYKTLARELSIDGKCIFYGQILPEKVTEFYARLDVFVLASRDETFGVVVIEAMACGLPVIATKCGGPEEIVTPSTGVLVSVANEQELTDAISFMIDNHISYDRAAVKKYVTTKYGQSAFLRNINDVFTDAINIELIEKNKK